MGKTNIGKPNPQEFWTKEETAAFLRVKLRTIENWMQKGVLPYYKFGRRSVRFKAEDLKAHIEQHCLRQNSVRKRLRK